MRTTDLVKWHRSVNEIRYKHNELELLKELSDDHGPHFRQHLQKYCKDNQIDLASLEKQREAFIVVEKKNKDDSKEKLLEDPQGTITFPDEDVVEEEHNNERIPAAKKDVDEMYEIFRKLFKKLALHLHPDKVATLTEQERHDRLEMFKEAKQALEEERYFFLLDLSDRFKIRMPKNYKQQTRWMKNKIKELDQEIRAQKETYNYSYAECETEKQKEQLIKMFLKQYYRI